MIFSQFIPSWRTLALLFVSLFFVSISSAQVSQYEPASLGKKDVASAYRTLMQNWNSHRKPLLDHFSTTIETTRKGMGLPRPIDEVEGEEQHLLWILQNRRFGDETVEASTKVFVPRTGGRIDSEKWQYSELSAIVDKDDNLIGIRLRSINYKGAGQIHIQDFSTDTIVDNVNAFRLTTLIEDVVEVPVVADKVLRIMRLTLPGGFTGDPRTHRLSKTNEQKIRLVYLHHGYYTDSSDVFGELDLAIRFIPNDTEKPNGKGQWVIHKTPGTQLHLRRGGDQTVNLPAGSHPLDGQIVEAIVTDLKYEKTYGFALFGDAKFSKWEEKGIENLLPVSSIQDETLSKFASGK